MRYSTSAMVLAAASTFTSVLAVPSVQHGHGHLHKKALVEERDVVIVYETKTVVWGEPEPTSSYVAPTTSAVYVTPTTSSSAAPVTSTTSTKAATTSSSSVESIIESAVTITTSALSKLLALGVCQEGINAVSNNGGSWIGTDGPYTIEFVNKASEDIVIVVWGSSGSWVNVKQPTITLSLAQGAKKTVSFAKGFSGAFSAVYHSTTLVNGQISNTWGEMTFTEEGVVDVSREVNMSGNTLSIVGPDCTTDMTTCVFVCDSGNVCTTGYSLENCTAGSQVGAQSGTDNGAASGGCGWSGASSAKLVATWS